VITVATLLVYAQVTNHDFLYFDDGIDVSENPYVKQGFTAKSIAWAFTTLEHANWQPITRLSHIFIAQFFGTSAPAGLLFNVLLHILTSLLLYAVLYRITGSTWKSGLVAALFALHPLHVESVAWLTERKDVLSGLLAMATIYAYAGYVEVPGWKKYCLSMVLFMMALMSKPMVVTLPCVLLLLDFWPFKRLEKEKIYRLVKEKIPFIVLSTGSSVITLVAHKNAAALHTLADVSMAHRLANAAVAYVMYIKKTLWPADLAAFYTIPVHYPAWQVAACLALLCAVTVMVIKASKQPYLFVGWFWFLGMLVPVIGIVSWGFHKMADRFTYLPSIGIFISIVWGVEALFKKLKISKKVMAAVSLSILMMLSMVSWVQVGYWKNFITLFAHANKVSPENWWGLTALGGAYAHEGRTGKSIELYREALAINSGFPAAHFMLGESLVKMGRKKEALAAFSKALQLNTEMTAALAAKAEILIEQGKLTEGKHLLLRALEINPAAADVHFSMGNLKIIQGKIDDAVSHFRKSLAADPDSSSAHNNLGVALYGQGKINEAAFHLKEAMRLNPKLQWMRDNVKRIERTPESKP